MTYCLGIVTPSGLVLASDSRSNAGVDQVQRVCKLAVFSQAKVRVIAILSQGNLATTQSVISQLRQAAGRGEASARASTRPGLGVRIVSHPGWRAAARRAGP